MKQTQPNYQAMSPEDRIRYLRGAGVNHEAARSTSDVVDFTNQFGTPNQGQIPQYAAALAEHLRKRGHNVSLNM